MVTGIANSALCGGVLLRGPHAIRALIFLGDVMKGPMSLWLYPACEAADRLLLYEPSP